MFLETDAGVEFWETTLKPKQGLVGLSSRFPRETYFELFHLIRLWAKALGKKPWSIKTELIFALVISVELFCVGSHEPCPTCD